MAKMLKIVSAVLEGIASASVEIQTGAEKPKTETENDVTYGDAVAAVMKGFSDSFWKNRALEKISKNGSSSDYKAAIGICEDDSMDDFWKARALEKVFERS